MTQCVVILHDGRMRVAKAEGRPPGIEGSVFRYRVEDGSPVLAAAPAAARLGTALKAVRTTRGLSQSALARLAGVSPSAISQAERGQRGLSLDTLLDLSAKLNITLDELLRGEVVPGYRLVRRDDPWTGSAGGPIPSSTTPGPACGPTSSGSAPGIGDAHIVHKGVELVTVATGLVQVRLSGGQPVLRGGEALLADSSRIEGWRNLSDREALVFWILRDDPSRPTRPSRPKPRSLSCSSAQAGQPSRCARIPGTAASASTPASRRSTYRSSSRSTRRSRPRAPPGRAVAGRGRPRRSWLAPFVFARETPLLQVGPEARTRVMQGLVEGAPRRAQPLGQHVDRDVVEDDETSTRRWCGVSASRTPSEIAASSSRCSVPASGEAARRHERPALGLDRDLPPLPRPAAERPAASRMANL